MPLNFIHFGVYKLELTGTGEEATSPASHLRQRVINQYSTGRARGVNTESSEGGKECREK